MGIFLLLLFLLHDAQKVLEVLSSLAYADVGFHVDDDVHDFTGY